MLKAKINSVVQISFSHPVIKMKLTTLLVAIFLFLNLGSLAACAREPKFTAQELKKVASINNLPKFSGKSEFLGGQQLSFPSGECTIQRFSTSATPNQVLDWYKTFFVGANWSLQGSSAHCVVAERESCMCTVFVHRSHGAQSRCEFELRSFESRRNR